MVNYGEPVARLLTSEQGIIDLRKRLDTIVSNHFRFIQSQEGVWTIYTEDFESSILVKRALSKHSNLKEYLKVNSIEFLR